MGLSPVPVEDFGGLDLVSDPGTVGWSKAIDCLNVDVDRRGRVRSRDGFVDFTAATAADPYLSLHVRLDGDVVATRLQNVAGLTSAGAVTATQATTGPAQTYADFGTATATYTCFGGLSDRIRRWDGAAFASPAGNPGARYVAVQPGDNRLVAAGVHTLPSGSSAAAASDHLVHISAAGDPDTWGADDWLLLTPGDGGVVTGAAAWRDLTFVFKQRKFFFFYGNSVDGSGEPIFNYRTVDVGIGARRAADWATCVAVAPDAVYFIADDRRIYKTTGGPPTPVSQAIEPAMFDTQSPFSQVSTVTGIQGLAYADGRLIVAYNAPTDAPLPRQFVYDIAGDYWLYWDLPGYGFAANTANTPTRYPTYFANTNANEISRVDRAATSDDGTAITSRYRSGFSDLGSPDMKRIHSWRAVGSGSPTLKLSTDFGALETGTAMTLGTSPAVAEAVRRYAPRGRRVSWQLSGTSAWSVNSLTAYVAGKRKAGEHVAA